MRQRDKKERDEGRRHCKVSICFLWGFFLHLMATIRDILFMCQKSREQYDNTTTLH